MRQDFDLKTRKRVSISPDRNEKSGPTILARLIYGTQEMKPLLAGGERRICTRQMRKHPDRTRFEGRTALVSRSRIPDTVAHVGKSNPRRRSPRRPSHLRDPLPLSARSSPYAFGMRCRQRRAVNARPICFSRAALILPIPTSYPVPKSMPAPIYSSLSGESDSLLPPITLGLC